MGTKDLPDIYARRRAVPEGVYIRQIPSAHVITNILHFRGLLYL